MNATSNHTHADAVPSAESAPAASPVDSQDGPPEGGLILLAASLGLGLHLGAWRFRSGAAADYLNAGYYRALAQTAERGKLHGLFLADTLTLSEDNLDRPSFGAVDPLETLATVVPFTTHLGLVATATTSFNEPYDLARRFSTLDHLSNGRAAWNVVTTFIPDVAANFGATSLPSHQDRYDRAEEFVDVVNELWGSWEDYALIGDKAAGTFADISAVHPIHHHGSHFSVEGALTLPRTPQGRPVIVQAGSSEAGRELAARTADAVFAVQNTVESAIAFRQDLRRRAVAHGRPADAVKVLPGIVPIIGSTVEEAIDRKRRLDDLATDAELHKLALRIGVPDDALDLDKPIPFDLVPTGPEFNASHGFRDAVLELARRDNLTVREVLYRNGGGHIQVIGTATDVADTITQWYQAGAVDGFNLIFDVLPDGLDTFVDTVVPILQERGVFHTEYSGRTFRENLNLPDDRPQR
ncbi:Nitrilotriacetate monooxygenase component A [Corynebacterium provencense]|uniref:Nitrilotriacetate monooxygenase component A n=1 Tax=Corynebacterium provencense TaxID=1737425 RepID=A0A2Z3YU63_9CORY|nr:LLM class flavin-dependent oxidoreductase [Corynebacterium provencense]AWT26740.1 Nitrilotriacetate monooxygenase component A [Corynebacterium provencense]